MRPKPTKWKFRLLRSSLKCAGGITVSTRNLTGRFFVLRSGSWSGRGLMLGSVRFYKNVTRHAGFRCESCGIGSLFKVEELPTVSAAMIFLTVSALVSMSCHTPSGCIRSRHISPPKVCSSPTADCPVHDFSISTPSGSRYFGNAAYFFPRRPAAGPSRLFASET